MLLDDCGHVRSHITRAVYQIQRFDFDCNLVMIRKEIMGTPPALGGNPLSEIYPITIVPLDLLIA